MNNGDYRILHSDINPLKYGDDDEVTVLDGSLCLTCKHRMGRTIIPYEYEDFDLNKEDLKREDGTYAPIVHHVCILLNMDLNHITLNCNKYEEIKQTKTPFKNINLTKVIK